MQKTPRDIMDTLQGLGIEAARVQTARDIVDDDEHVRARGYLETYDHPAGAKLPVEGIPFKMSLTPARVRRAGPAFGADNDYVFRSLLGLNDQEVAELSEVVVP
jgi:crotonobetainyl-CoA:carnitine CoA-transferase CaiB-like acyl-CoA transferase